MAENKARYRLLFARKGLNSKGKALIQIEVYFNRNTRKLISTNIYILEEQWDDKRLQINSKHQNHIRLNRLLNSQIDEIEAYELDLIYLKKKFTPEALKRFTNNEADDFFRLAIRSVNGDGRLGEKSRPRTISHLKVFNEICGPMTVNEVTYVKIKEFDKFLSKQTYNTNTISSYHKSIKRCINALIREDEMLKNPYDKFQIKRIKGHRTYLSPAEVEKIAALEYSDPGIQRTADRFLISCGTGLRFSDCYMLDSKKVYEGEAGKGLVIDLKRMKKVEFPVKNPAYEYFNGIADQRLRKYLKPDGFLFFRKEMNSSTQNAIDNKNLKKIALDAEITKHLSFHCSRHTALTEVAAQTGNVFIVMKFGGIRKTDTAMVYIHLASEKF